MATEHESVGGEKSPYEAFFEIVRTGTQEEARKYLIEHLNDFDPTVRDEIVAAFVRDAIADQADGAKLLADFQKQGIAALEGLAGQKKDLAVKDKALEIKESL